MSVDFPVSFKIRKLQILFALSNKKFLRKFINVNATPKYHFQEGVSVKTGWLYIERRGKPSNVAATKNFFSPVCMLLQ